MSQNQTKKHVVTAALPYSNGRLHVGHMAGAYLPSDIYARYLKARGHEVAYVCGSDDHGVAILLRAQKEGKSPEEIVGHYHDSHKKSFEALGIHFDVYGSTSRTPGHKALSQEFFIRLYENGFFEKKTTEQFYDESKQAFLPDRYVIGTCGFCGEEDQNGDQCESCGKALDTDSLKEPKSVLSQCPATRKSTTHWFLDLSQCKEAVQTWLEKAALKPQTKTYVQSLIDQGLIQRAMTRDLAWGVPVPIEDPEAKGKVLYVWFDAPIGYLSNLEYYLNQQQIPLAKWWGSHSDSQITHFIGEDNTIFHCLIWIAMLSAHGGYQLPSAVAVNQFLNIKFENQQQSQKISKSRGTAVWIEDLINEGVNPDSVRYYLTAIAPENQRTVYQPADLALRNDTDLANTLGNFVNRVIRFSLKYAGNQVPLLTEAKVDDQDRDFVEKLSECQKKVSEEIESFYFKSALESLMKFVRDCNQYIDFKEPWVTRKSDMELTHNTLFYGLNAIRALGVLLDPFLPFTAKKIRTIFDEGEDQVSWSTLEQLIASGATIEAPEILFAKMRDDS